MDHSLAAVIGAPRRPVLAAAAALVAISAWAGAAGLILGFLEVGAEVEPRLPFDSPAFGGLALATIVAIPMTLVADLAWRGDPMAGTAAVVAGLLQIAWIAVQVVIIRELTFFHPLYVGIGLGFVIAGRRTRAGTRAP